MSVKIQGPASSIEAVAARRLDAVALPEESGPPADGGEQFRSVLGSLGRAIDGGEKLMHRALTPSVGALGAAELIALQAGIYRYSEAIDLAAKLVDRAAAAVRTTLQAGGQ